VFLIYNEKYKPNNIEVSHLQSSILNMKNFRNIGVYFVGSINLYGAYLTITEQKKKDEINKQITEHLNTIEELKKK
jgi:hypothetical protein